MVKIREESLYEPLKRWFESERYNALITAGRRQVFLAAGLFTGVGFLEPDIVGYGKEWYSEWKVVTNIIL